MTQQSKENTGTTQPEKTKPLRLTKKDREVIEYFFTHFQPDGFIIHQPQKKIPPQEILTYREKEKTPLDFAKVVKDAQLGPVNVTLQFTKKEPSGAKLAKDDYNNYKMTDEETKIYLSKWHQGYNWDLQASTSFDADDIKIPGFKNYLIDRYFPPPTEHERLLSEHTLDSLRDIATIATVIKSIIGSLTGEKAVDTVCSNEFNKVMVELQALQKKQKDRREFGPIVDKLKDSQPEPSKAEAV